MKWFFSFTNKFLAESCGYLVMILMLIIMVDVILRNAGFPIFGIVEVGIYITVAVVYLGLGHCEDMDGHVRLTAVVSRLRPSWSAFLSCIMDILSFSIMCLAFYACLRSAVSSFTDNEAVMAADIALYTWPARVALVVGLFFYCGQILVSFGKKLEIFRNATRATKTAVSGENIHE